MVNLITLLGIIAGCCTTGASVPQVLKIIKTKKTRDLSLAMYCTVTIGATLWIVYGLMIKSLPIVLANSISLILVSTILSFKIRYK